MVVGGVQIVIPFNNGVQPLIPSFHHT